MTAYTELIKELRYCVDGDEECAGCKRYGQMGCDVYLMEEAADAIEQLEAAVPKWIPVTVTDDGLTTDFPYENDGKWVIITNGRSISVERVKKGAYDHFSPRGRWFELEDATHWMPLPEPPKEEQT